ncbi:MAG: hypothetical protein ACYTJ0_04480 [Planctomycetota bacterium]|jgi:hypothetical protein
MPASRLTIGRIAAVLLLVSAPVASGQTSAATAPPPIPLLREGSRLLNSAGRLQRDAATGWWTFFARPDAPGSAPIEFVMLPSRQLEQMEQILRSEPGSDVAFEVSGEVFVYRTRNFLLPTGSAQVIPTAETPAPPPPDPAAAPTGDDDSVEAIMRELAEAVGPLQRRSDVELPVTVDTGPGPRGGTDLVWRRGRLRRTDRGAWVFVFDADAEGTADPPLIVMPCLLLERLEDYVARAGRTAPVLLSGRVYRYGNRSYVMPSVFRAPRERTPLAP